MIVDDTAKKAAIAREKCRRSFSAFAKSAISERGPLPIDLQWDWYLDLICDSLQELSHNDTDLRTLVIALPPRHLKSTLTSVLFPAWVWLRDPSHRFICASYSGRLSERDARHNREIIGSKWYTRLRETSGVQWDLKNDSRAMSLFETTKHGARFSTSTGAAATGHGAHTLIIDDPLLVRPTYSDDEINTVSQWYTGTMRTRFDRPANGKTIVIMQRVHERDLAGQIIESSQNDPSVRCVVLPLEFDRSTASIFDMRKNDGELLSPSHFDTTTVATIKKSMSKIDFDRQFQQRPSSAQGTVICVTDFMFWFDDRDVAALALDRGVSHIEALEELRESYPDHKKVHLSDADLNVAGDILCSWDCSFEATITSDFCAGQAWQSVAGVDCLVDTICQRMAFSETVSAIIAFAEKHKTNKLLIEKKANGHGVIDVLKKLNKFQITEADPRESKTARALRWTQKLRSADGHQCIAVRHPLVSDWTDRYLACMRSFPKGAHDDEVDATTQTLGHLSSGSVDWERVLFNMHRSQNTAGE